MANGHLDALHLASPLSPSVSHYATPEEKKRLWWRNALVNGCFIGAWFTFSIMLSMYNKWMFSPEHFGFPYPLLVTTFHFFIQFLLAALLRLCSPHRFKPEHSPSRRDYARKVAPTGFATALDIGLSNLSLKTITLSFFTMVKSSSLIFVLFFAFFLRLERFSWRLVGVIMLIVGGVVLMVATETHFHALGFFMVLTASALGGLRWGLTQLLLKSRHLGLSNPAATIFWLSPVMGASLLVVSLAIERSWHVVDTKFFDGLGATLHTMAYLVSPGVLAFCMVLSEFYIIQRAGVVPMSIAGIAKEVTTISVSALTFGDQLTPLNVVGVGITVCGIGLFTYHKYRRSMESTVPLDAHGNPIEPEDEAIELREGQEDVERMPLVHDADDDDRDADEQRTLFEVGDEEDDADEVRSVNSYKIGRVAPT